MLEHVAQPSATLSSALTQMGWVSVGLASVSGYNNHRIASAGW